ncbi:MAG: DUF502 domain-containing protein [Hyphomicrobiales bacterium]
MHFGRYLIAGVLTVMPLWVTILVFEFVFSVLSQFGIPWVRLLSTTLQPNLPVIADWLRKPWVDDTLAAASTALGLYVLGWAATRVVGRQVVAVIERLIERIPVLKFVYGAVKKVIAVVREKPEGLQRVVLIDFPHTEMKCVGIVMRMFDDAAAGGRLAAVFVPTAPNPSSGYLEIVPVDRLISTDWSFDQAMNFCLTMGAVAPDSIHYTKSAPTE